MIEVMLAGVLFLGTHFGLSSTALRAGLAGRLGENGFLLLYSLVAIVTLGLLISLYNEVPRTTYFWLPSPELYWVPKLVMPVALILALGGFMVRNPTVVGQDRLLENEASALTAVRGVNRITRHPFQWGVVLWAVSHLAANGDRVSVVFFGTFALLGLAGGVAIDRKKRIKLGAHWTPFAQATSNVPFAAIFSGRNRLVLRELWLPILVGLLAYFGIFHGHRFISGVGLA